MGSHHAFTKEPEGVRRTERIRVVTSYALIEDHPLGVWKGAGLFCGFFLSKGEVFGYVELLKTQTGAHFKIGSWSTR